MNMSIQSRLQSRISKRRNFIRTVEQDVAMMKTQRHEIRELDLGGFEDVVVESLNENLREARGVVRELAADQKLDKRISGIILGVVQNRRYYGLSDI